MPQTAVQPWNAAPSRRGRALSALLWSVGAFVGLQLLLAVVMECWCPQWRDPEYTRKLAGLRERMAEEPGRPLLLMLGSSRTFYGFQAGQCDGQSGPDGRPMVAFNFGLTAAGPIKEWLCLHSLLDAGVRPDVLLVEVLPPLLNEPGPERTCEENWLYVPGLAATDALLLRRYYSRPSHVSRAWLRSRLLPCRTHRRRIVKEVAESWLPPHKPAAVTRMDRSGWVATERETVAADEQRRGTELAHRQYAEAFDDFRIGAGPAAALHDLLDACGREKIPVALVLMPEGTTFRRWYPPEMEAALQEFLTDLHGTQGAAVLDARTWIADAHFADSHHLLPAGAALFTTRLAEEIQRLAAVRRTARFAEPRLNQPCSS